MNNSTYAFHKPKVSIFEKVRSYFTGILDRSGVYSQFLKDNNIDPSDISHHSITRNKYLIRTHHLEHLSDLRNQVAYREIVTLEKSQKTIALEIQQSHYKLEREQQTLQELNTELTRVMTDLKNSGNLTALQKAHLQGDRGTLEASIKNQKVTVNAVKKLIEDTQNIKEGNLKEFIKFLEELRSVYNITVNTYIKLAARKIHSMGFTIYDAELPDYSDSIKDQLRNLKDK